VCVRCVCICVCQAYTYTHTTHLLLRGLHLLRRAPPTSRGVEISWSTLGFWRTSCASNRHTSVDVTYSVRGIHVGRRWVHALSMLVRITCPRGQRFHPMMREKRVSTMQRSESTSTNKHNTSNLLAALLIGVRAVLVKGDKMARQVPLSPASALRVLHRCSRFQRSVPS
jgi:hypothetical protein